jgi:hypothetical protein
MRLLSAWTIGRLAAIVQSRAGSRRHPLRCRLPAAVAWRLLA